MAHLDQIPGIRPRPSTGRRLDVAARAGFPACVTVLLMLLTIAPWDIIDQATLLPAVALVCVWFWSLSRPTAMPPPVIFLIGLLMDLLGTLPLGVGAFTLLAVHGVALATRRRLARFGFAWIWIVFAAVAASASILIWLAVMLLSFRLLSPEPLIFLTILAVAVFPVLAVPFAVALRSIADPEQA